MYKVNDILRSVETKEISYEGYGVIRYPDFAIFVENLWLDEVADIKIFWANKKIAFAKVLKHLKVSNKRVENVDKELIDSGSAPLAILDYQDQLIFKQEVIEKLVNRNLKNVKVKRIIASEKILNYRNKITLHAKVIKDKLEFGNYEKNSHNLIIQEKLPLANLNIEEVYLQIKDVINNLDLNCKKSIEKIMLRYSEYEDKAQLVIYSKTKLAINNQILSNLSDIPKLGSIINEYGQNKIKYEILLGDDSLVFKLENLLFKVHYDAFYQVNDSQIFKLYSEALNSLDDNKKSIVDAFAGVGTIGMFFAKRAKKVLSIEINQNASKSAEDNAKLNKIINMNFVAADVTKYFATKDIKEFDAIIFDPPRAGVDKEVIKASANTNVGEIIYISCNPRTLVRDIIEFEKYGYVCEEIQPVDMFPQTYHIEAVAVFKNNKNR